MPKNKIAGIIMNDDPYLYVPVDEFTYDELESLASLIAEMDD